MLLSVAREAWYCHASRATIDGVAAEQEKRGGVAAEQEK
jgi:hypothetical protein